MAFTKGIVLSPIHFKMSTNYQAIYDGTHSFIYSDELCIKAATSTTVPDLTPVPTDDGRCTSELRPGYKVRRCRMYSQQV